MFSLEKRRGKGTYKRLRDAKKQNQTKQENQQTNMIGSNRRLVSWDMIPGSTQAQSFKIAGEKVQMITPYRLLV